jgi:hypothetical protein
MANATVAMTGANALQERLPDLKISQKQRRRRRQPVPVVSFCRGDVLHHHQLHHHGGC